MLSDNQKTQLVALSKQFETQLDLFALNKLIEIADQFGKKNNDKIRHASFCHKIIQNFINQIRVCVQHFDDDGLNTVVNKINATLLD